MKNLFLFGPLAFAALVSGMLVGCGGSSANVSSDNPTVTVTGGIPVTSGSLVTDIPNSTSVQTISVKLADGTLDNSTILPPGTGPLKAGDPIGTIEPNVPLLYGIDFDTSGPEIKKPLITGDLQTSYDGTTWSTVGYVKSIQSGLALVKRIAVQRTIYVRMVGPFKVENSQTKKKLTIQNLEARILTYLEPVSRTFHYGNPTHINLRIPVNGASTAGAGIYASVVSHKKTIVFML